MNNACIGEYDILCTNDKQYKGGLIGCHKGWLSANCDKGTKCLWGKDKKVW